MNARYLALLLVLFAALAPGLFAADFEFAAAPPTWAAPTACWDWEAAPPTHKFYENLIHLDADRPCNLDGDAFGLLIETENGERLFLLLGYDTRKGC